MSASIARRSALPAFAAFAMVLPFGLSAANLTTATFVVIAAIGATGLNVLVGYAGQISLGHAFFLAAGAYTGAVLGGDHGVSAAVWIPAAGAVAALLGALVGPMALRLQGLYLAIVTLGIVFIGQHVLLNSPGISGGPQGRTFPAVVIGPFDFSPGQTLEHGGLTVDRSGLYYYLGLAILAAATAFAWSLRRTRCGRAMLAVREREAAASLMGVDVGAAKVAAFVVSAALAGVSGALYASYRSFAQPTQFNLDMSIQFIAAIIVGGMGTTAGPLLGSAVATKVQGGPGVDVASKTISIGDINALTGPAAPLGNAVAAGHRVFFEALNARGGIDGWMVKLTVKDSGYKPQEHVQLYNQVQGSVALLNSFGSPTTKAIQPQVDQQKIVTFPASFDSLWGADSVMAPVGAPYSVDIANVLDYYTDSGSKKPKIGIVYQNDEYGADGLRGFKAAKSALGFADAGQQSFNVGDSSFTAQVQKLKAAGAHAVVVIALPSATGPIVGTAATLGFKPQWILQGPAYLEQLMPPSIYFTLAYAQGQVQAAILRKAIQSGNLTRAGILTAKQNLGTVDLGGIAPSVSYEPQPGPPTRKSLITRVDPTVPGFLKAVAPDHGSQVADSLKIG